MNDPKKDDQQMTDEELAKKIVDAQKASEQKEENEESESGFQNQNSEINQLKEALARSMADLQNFKRRSEEEKGNFVKFANAQLLKSLLPIFDNLDRSIAHLPANLKTDNWAQGIVHVHTDLFKTLDSLGIKKMKTVDEKLDPKKHEALMSGVGQKDIITEEFEPGYEMNGEVIKPAKVKVGDGS